MRNFVVNFGEKIINVLFVISCVVVIISGLVVAAGSVLMGLLTIIIGLVLVVLTFLTLFVLLDIRAQLIRLNEKA